MTDQEKSAIIAEATEAGEGALARAANRGWSTEEQIQAMQEATAAVYNDYGVTFESLTA